MDLRLSVLCMRLKAWLAACVSLLLARLPRTESSACSKVIAYKQSQLRDSVYLHMLTSGVRHSVARFGQRLMVCDPSMREKAWRSRKRGA